MAPENVAVRVTGVRRISTSEGAELLVSLKISREGNLDNRISLPVQFEIGGARSQLTVEMEGSDYDLKDHPIPAQRSPQPGWGRVSIPAEADPAAKQF